MAIDSLIGGYIRAFSREANNKNIPRAADVIELIESLETNTDPVIEILLFSMVQGAKIHLKHLDPVRMSMERSEYLSNLFINIMENQK